jgi:2',3'-cyclic-nucleotide 2'-phosphodiesterase (5'-nucleotidase family)|tara:strand:+ start:492 stop:1418 length:927 start_codon:yes stop_codon:yes gene_type:complete
MLTRFIYLFLVVMAVNVYSQASLFILHTNNTNGALENCYCPDHPLGSIEKRSLYIQDFINANPRTVVLDAGDFFTMSQKLLKDSLVCEAYATIPYDGILLGDQELTRDEKFLNTVLPKLESSIILSNLESPNLSFVRKYKVIKRGGLSVGIIGVLGGNAMKYYPKDIRDSIILTDPVSTVNEIVKRIRPRTDLIILLSHQGFEQDQVLAKSIKGVNVILGAHSQTVPKEPTIVNDILISQAGREGYYVGLIELKLSKYKKIEDHTVSTISMTQDMPDHPRIMELIKYFEDTTGLINRKKLQALDGKNN